MLTPVTFKKITNYIIPMKKQFLSAQCEKGGLFFNC